MTRNEKDLVRVARDGKTQMVMQEEESSKQKNARRNSWREKERRNTAVLFSLRKPLATRGGRASGTLGKCTWKVTLKEGNRKGGSVRGG